MRLTAANKEEFLGSIDPEYSTEDSIVLRYAGAFSFSESPTKDLAFKALLKETSIREGARITPVLTYRGVDIHLMDETSLMHTGTLKSVDGCVSIA